MKNYFKIFFGFVLFFSLSLQSSQAQDNCADVFSREGNCPSNICYLGCLAGLEYDGCQLACQSLDCVQIKKDDCPLDRCQILKGCIEEDICYYKSQAEVPLCGGLAYSDQDVECCEGLEKRCGIRFFDGTCDMEGKNSMYGVPICIACGNGVCGQFENECNCPEDCSFPLDE